jgi:hypothetical protein
MIQISAFSVSHNGFETCVSFSTNTFFSIESFSSSTTNNHTLIENRVQDVSGLCFIVMEGSSIGYLGNHSLVGATYTNCGDNGGLGTK